MIAALLVSSALAAPVPTRTPTPTDEYRRGFRAAALTAEAMVSRHSSRMLTIVGPRPLAQPTATRTPTALLTPRGHYFLTKAAKATPDALYVFQYYGVEVLRADPQGTVVYLNPKYVPRGHWLVTATATASPTPKPAPTPTGVCHRDGHAWDTSRREIGVLNVYGYDYVRREKVVRCRRCGLWREVWR